MLATSFRGGNIMNQFLVLLAIIPAISFAGTVDRYNFKTQTYQPTLSNTNLVEYKVQTNSYRVNFTNDPIPAFGTTMYAEYTTKEIDQVEEYAVVQYIQGCMFDATLNQDGSITKGIQNHRQFFGQSVPFKHTSMVIDSVDVDPIYNSFEDHRHGAYRWNEVPGSYDKNTEHFYYHQAPDTPRLYVRDTPSGAFQTFNGAKNVSMKFETCLIETSKVPKVAAPDLDLRPQAIACFKWNHSFVYNFKTQEYENPTDIDPFCLK